MTEKNQIRIPIRPIIANGAHDTPSTMSAFAREIATLLENCHPPFNMNDSKEIFGCRPM
jgi:hypothetical protein